jgi:hypothetical protein
MTADLSKETLDALEESLRQIGGSGFPNWADDAADAITALRAEKEALQREVNEQESRANENKARATAAEAQLAAAMEGEVRVRALEWNGSDLHSAAQCETGEYEIEGGWKDKIGGVRWYAWLHRTHDDGSDCYFNGTEAVSMEAAKAAAQADYARRILAALEPNPAAQAERDALIAATLERDKFGKPVNPAQPQPDALTARDRAKVVEGMREAAEMVEDFAPGGDRYEYGHDDVSMRVAIRGAILAAADAREAGE